MNEFFIEITMPYLVFALLIISTMGLGYGFGVIMNQIFSKKVNKK